MKWQAEPPNEQGWWVYRLTMADVDPDPQLSRYYRKRPVLMLARCYPMDGEMTGSFYGINGEGFMARLFWRSHWRCARLPSDLAEGLYEADCGREMGADPPDQLEEIRRWPERAEKLLQEAKGNGRDVRAAAAGNDEPDGGFGL